MTEIELKEKIAIALEELCQCKAIGLRKELWPCAYCNSAEIVRSIL